MAVLSRGGEPLTPTGDIVGRWREHSDEVMNPTNMLSVEEAESEALGEVLPISPGRVL